MQLGLITPSYRGDLERCKLLCDSVDRFVSGFDQHLIIVNDDDVGHFKELVSNRRVVEPVSRHLPYWLQPLPFGLRWKKRKVWLSLFTQPVQGWHVQQIVKLAAAASSSAPISVCLDSDTVFVRNFDLKARFGGDMPLPLLRQLRGITQDMPWHTAWLKNTCRLLGLEQPTLPADDHIGNVIAWRRQTVRALLRRIERTTGSSWSLSLCRTRAFSEYLLYGYHVASDADAARSHVFVDISVCATYWGSDELDAAGLKKQIDMLEVGQVAIGVQSFSGTSIKLIRDVVKL